MNFLVIDIGTSGCRAAVVSGSGEILSQGRRPISIDQPRPTFAEIDTDRLWRQVQKVILCEVNKHPGITIDAIGVSAMLAYVFLDKAGCPLMPAITYADNRATSESRKIEQLFTPEKFFAITGRRPSPLLLAPKIQWIAKHRSDVYRNLDRIIGLKDEIVRRLSGIIATDVAHLDYSGLYNVHKGHLETVILDALNINQSIFATPSAATAIVGTLTAKAAARLDLPDGIPVIAGSSDGTTAMYGAGVLNDGNAVLVSGTTDVLMMGCAPASRNFNHALSINSGMLPGAYLVGGPLGLSGGCLQFFEQLLQTSAARLEAEINLLPPGSDGLLILPGLTGERSPYWKAHLTGGVIGLTPHHRSEHLLRAVMEGCALRILKLLNILSQSRSPPQALNVVGGGANIDVWNQIRSDVSGLTVRKLAVTEATTLGTALFCRAAVDQTQSLQELSNQWIKVSKRFRPVSENTQAYKKLARLFENYMEANTDVMRGLNELKQ
jgi:xylulokinase